MRDTQAVVIRHVRPPMNQALPSSLFPVGRVRQLRAEIEAVTGRRLGTWSPSAAGVIWHGSSSGAAFLKVCRHPVLTVSPGPLLSPYDGIETGFTSLRIRLDGEFYSGAVLADDFGTALREKSLFGRNRFPKAQAIPLREGARPILVLVTPDLARSPSDLRALVERVVGAEPQTPVLAAGAEGCPDFTHSDLPNLTILREPVDPWRLFGLASSVCVMDWEEGCEARLAGLEIRHLGSPQIGGLPETAALLHRRYGAGVHHFDPWTRQPISAADALDKVAWLRDRFVENDKRTILVGISGWKRPALDAFAAGPHGPALHTMTAEDAVAKARQHDGRVWAWATRMPEQLPALCAQAGLDFARIEDGFVRSVGLGASLTPGASIVDDDSGIYYDPRTESRLTRILRETAFTPELADRARALRESIVARRLSKYNVGLVQDRIDRPREGRIVLVPGQVEDDASVQYGSPTVRTNRDLLRAARARNPKAIILYKPHPDVEAGFRPGAIPEAEALTLADRLVGGIAIVDVLDQVDHIETMTSLAGFEGLLRGLSVATHGRPFYSGWGLTEDLAPGADRGRHLALDELVAGALILYPRYLDPVALKPCTPEQLLDRLSTTRATTRPSPLAIGRLRQQTMRARYAVLTPILRRLRARRGVGGGDGAER